MVKTESEKECWFKSQLLETVDIWSFLSSQVVIFDNKYVMVTADEWVGYVVRTWTCGPLLHLSQK